ncbi:hypothetical protein KJ836_02555 [Patescibacteria group bacterium]|nr:hypothetical protein [Patescibacteria group bacterium]
MKLWDMSDMYKLINEYPRQFERGFRMAEFLQIPDDITEVVIIAVSYNAAVAMIIKNLFAHNFKVPVTIYPEEGWPRQIGPKTLCIAVSLCGHRVEVLSAVKTAYTANAKIVVVTTGSELEVFAKERNLPIVLMDKELPEWKFRMGQGLILSVIIQLLINARVLSIDVRQKILQAATAIEALYLPKLGQKLANDLTGLTVLIYSSFNYAGLARLVKALINILWQTPSFTGSFIDLQYLEVYGFTHGKGYTKQFLLFLQDKTDDELIQATIKKLEHQLSAGKAKQFTLDLPGANHIEKTLASIMLFYWTIYWLLNKSK